MRTIFVLAVLLLASVPVIAAEPSWESDTARLESIGSQQLSDTERCQATWNILWPWAKKGNVEARTALLLDMAMNFRELPGRSGDAISRVRDATILTVHSVSDQKNETTDAFLEAIRRLQPIAGRDEFINCIDKNRSRDCARIAVDKKFVPSFDDFASEIDMFVENNRLSTCVFDAP